ncbi:Abi-alpha family protein [Falsiroseomonas sp.]|uniref:Abi-alpha family protein n=1 Tax=Falsiroseomonas sp. TaxID=2870721 RepID=UPI003F702FD6
MDDETAKAAAVAVGKVGDGVGEVAKFGSNALGTGRAFGGWLKDTFGTIPEDLLGIAGGDWLHHQRRRNLAALEAKTAAIRQRIGAGPPHEPSVSVVLPLLQAAADEGRPELQDLWAALLACAMEAGGGRGVRRAFFDTLRAMEPDDALLFKAIMDVSKGSTVGVIKFAELADASGLNRAAQDVTRDALMRLALIQLHGTVFGVTSYGNEFWRACNP